MYQNQETGCLAEEFETIFTAHFPIAKHFALMLLKSEEDAEDIAQDVFTKLWTQPQVWSGNKDIATYIYVMTKHATFNFIKHKKIVQEYQEGVIQESLMNELFNSEDPFDPIYYREALLIIKLVIERQPERRRIIFEMSRLKQMSNLEIAEALNLSVRTVEQQIYRTLLELKKTIFIAFFLFPM